MFIRQGISIGNLLLDTSNYRIVKQSNQKNARDAIIAEQDKKLVELAKDIVAHGVNPFDLPLVIPAQDGNGNFVVIEGNRRLTAIKLMMEPDLAEGTSIHTAFKRLNKSHADAIPMVLDCVIAPTKQAGLVWIARKHANGLDGAGTEPWSAIAKERADAEQNMPTPNLDVVNFVLTNPALDSGVKSTLLGSKFNITTLSRLIGAPDVRDAIGITLKDGKITSDYDQARVMGILTDVVTIIATKLYKGRKFTERLIDSDEDRIEFINDVASGHPKKKKSDKPWAVSGTPNQTVTQSKPKPHGGRSTPSTEDQVNLVPKDFKMKLPSGKINDVFIELKTLNVVQHRHAVSVLFRVFFEFTLDEYLKNAEVTLAQGKDHLIDKLKAAIEAAKSSKLMTDKELKTIRVAISNKESFLSPETLNAFVHSSWMNPDPLQLKLAWLNVQPFIDRLWKSKI